MARDYIETFQKAFENLGEGEAFTVAGWEALFHSCVPDTLYAYKAGEGQPAAFQDMATSVCPGLAVGVIGFHTSKSTPMPVIRIALDGGWAVYMRNNLHDIAVAFANENDETYGKQTPLPDAVQAALLAQSPVAPAEEYLAVEGKKRGYRYKEWTDEEMADPRILRVQRSNGTWSEVTGAAKDRWIARHRSTEWTHRDWGSTHWIASRDGETPQNLESPYSFDSDTRFFFQVTHGYTEGIDKYAPARASDYWVPGKSAGYVTAFNPQAAKDLLAAIALRLG